MSTLLSAFEQPVKVTTTSDGKKQYSYDKNLPNEALQNKYNSIFTNENDQGFFTEITEPNKKLSHLLKDNNFDGIFDEYRLNQFDEKGNRTFYDDYDFDGEFDLIGYDYPNENLLCIDKDADGNIDSYMH